MIWLSLVCALTQPPQHPPLEVPVPLDDRLTVELVAREPAIVTPTGVAVDQRGRVWAIENQTHHRPADYKGPQGDRIRIYDDFGPSGEARRVKTFAEGFKNGMGLAIARNGDIYFATRSELMVLRDTDGDDVADQENVIARLDTAGDYPHNGLSGFAFDIFDNVYFGFGENLGASYKLIGSDGTILSGGGEGGNIYRCRPDGSKLVRVATGFWNPFHLAFDAFGRLFAVDNDPDSRPPCRLLHIVQDGDYGYRFRNGRKGLHPFTAWNGELPGTLPMVAGTGEAPSGIVAYESIGLPAEYTGNLIVTAWGDHVIQRFRLQERGASFTSQAETLVRGGESFYPVAIATAPDGSLVVTDWADKSYPLHGKGRIWRIRMKQPPGDNVVRPKDIARLEPAELRKLLGHASGDVRVAAAGALLERGAGEIDQLRKVLERDPSARTRLSIVWAQAKLDPDLTKYATGLAEHVDPDPAVEAEIVRLLNERATPRSRASIAGSKETQGHPLVEMQLLLSSKSQQSAAPVAARAIAANDPFLVHAGFSWLARTGGVAKLSPLVHAEDPKVRARAVVALRLTGDIAARKFLPDLLSDPGADVRRTAIQWVGEEQLTEFEAQLEVAAAKPPVTRELFEAFLATKDLFAGNTRKPTDEPSGEDFIVKVLNDNAAPVALRTIALRSLRPDHPALGTNQLRELFDNGDAGLRLESVRTLATRAGPAAQRVLREIAANPANEAKTRATAIVGLSHSFETSTDTAQFLIKLLDSDQAELRREALRSLRSATDQSEVSALARAWLKKRGSSATAEDADQVELIVRGSTARDSNGDSAPARTKDSFAAVAAGHGDAAAGERVFFHPNGPQCFACHRVNGRGGVVGPDLSVIGRSQDREKLVRSILEPSKDIAPQYANWTFALRNGQVVTGIILQQDPRGVVLVGDSQGKTTELNVDDIEQRKAQDRSIMPDNIVDRMTRAEFQDLITFLLELK